MAFWRKEGLELKYSNLKLDANNGTMLLKADSEKFGEQEIIFQSGIRADLERFLKENLLCLDLENNLEVTNLKERPNKKLIGYLRMYWRDGWWGCRWFSESEEKITELETYGLENVSRHIMSKWKNGCNFFMAEDVNKKYKQWGADGNRFLVQPIGNDNYLVMIDTTFGNHDYPIRIYVYREIEDK